MIAGWSARSDGPHRVQRGQAHELQARPAQAEEGGSGEGGRVEARQRGQHLGRRRLLRDHRHEHHFGRHDAGGKRIQPKAVKIIVRGTGKGALRYLPKWEDVVNCAQRYIYFTELRPARTMPPRDLSRECVSRMCVRLRS